MSHPNPPSRADKGHTLSLLQVRTTARPNHDIHLLRGTVLLSRVNSLCCIVDLGIIVSTYISSAKSLKLTSNFYSRFSSLELQQSHSCVAIVAGVYLVGQSIDLHLE